MKIDDLSNKANFLIEKFSKYNKKDNFKEIDNLEAKLTYYNLFFDNYQEMFIGQFSFVNDIKIILNLEINVFMITIENHNSKKIIFDAPHYRIINFNFPVNDWELIKIR